MKLTTETQKLTNAIHDCVRGKLMAQFRKGNPEKELKNNLDELVSSSISRLIMFISTETIKECREQEQKRRLTLIESYEGFIPKPETNLSNRIKFLFIGKL